MLRITEYGGRQGTLMAAREHDECFWVCLDDVRVLFSKDAHKEALFLVAIHPVDQNILLADAYYIIGWDKS